MNQSMSYAKVKELCKEHAMKFGARIQSGEITLEQAHKMMQEDKLDLFQVAGLAQAIACFQCSV
jgi:hypothetical protein